MNSDVREIRIARPSIVCDFCNRYQINTLEWGPMYRYKSITVHYFCLLFSANLSQNGDDDEGILGFLVKDISKEIKRGAKLKCTYCKGLKATVGCSVKTCKKSFHYTCGYEKSCNFQFIGKFESYCPSHKPKIDIPEDLTQFDCPICYCSVERNETLIWPPCCRKAVFHRLCVMKMAHHHGYFFKCPLCNDVKTFESTVKMCGVFVPQIDAAWEREPNAFADQTAPYSTCDAEKCLCPNGRNHHEKETKWNICRCGGCGSSAIHKECGDLSSFSWKCLMCSTVLAGSGILSSQSSQSSDDNDCETTITSQECISRPESARISRPDFYADRDYKSCSSSDEDEPVPNVVEVLQWNQDLLELENEVESPALAKAGKIFDELYLKKYKVEGGRNKKNSSTSQASTSTVCSINHKSDGLGVNASDAQRSISELSRNKFVEHIERFKKYSQQIKDSNTSNQYNDYSAQTQTSNIETKGSNTQSEKNLLEILTTPKLNRRKLNFESKHANLPSVKLAQSNPVTLGPEIDLSSKLLSASSKLTEGTCVNTITVEPDYEIPDTPETNRQGSSWSPLSNQNSNSATRSNCVSDSDVSFSAISTNGSVHKSPVKNQNETTVVKTISSPNGKIPVINLDNKPPKAVEVVDLDDDDDNDDDIQIESFVPAIKILSVTSLSKSSDYVPKSAAFMRMLSKFNSHVELPMSKQSATSTIVRKPTTSKPIVEIILDVSDEETSDVQLAQQNNRIDDNNTSASGKSTRQWPTDDGNSKRPRLSSE